MPDEQTCCGTCYWNEQYQSWCYILASPPRLSAIAEFVLHVNYCFACGAHLLPGGAIERRDEVMGECLLIGTECGMAIEEFRVPVLSPGERFRVLLVRGEEGKSDARPL